MNSKAYHIATTGRPGPVLVDIPDNLQRVDINPDELISFTPPESENNELIKETIQESIIKCKDYIKNSKRPIFVLGWGIHLSNARSDIMNLLNKLNIPFVPTWAIADILPSEHPLYVGTFGTHGTRAANFAIQNSDLVISIGSRLDTKTLQPQNTFA